MLTYVTVLILLLWGRAFSIKISGFVHPFTCRLAYYEYLCFEHSWICLSMHMVHEIISCLLLRILFFYLLHSKICKSYILGITLVNYTYIMILSLCIPKLLHIYLFVFIYCLLTTHLVNSQKKKFKAAVNYNWRAAAWEEMKCDVICRRKISETWLTFYLHLETNKGH